MVTINARTEFLVVGDSPDQSKGEDHPFLLVDGQAYRSDRVGINPRSSGGNYALTRISGYGGWKRPSDGSFWAFRQADHMRRVHQNALAIPINGRLPSVEELTQWSLTSLGLGIPDLKVAQDVYGRTLVVQGAVALGVGSRGGPHIVQFTRDLIDYVPPNGLALLIPGMLCRRPSPFMGRPTEKAASNYDLPHFWKVVAKERGYDEILMLNWNGQEIAETSGSIPLCLYTREREHITARIPRLASWRLNSLVTDTLIELMRRVLGWEVIDDEPLTYEHMRKADEICVQGSWSGLAVVTKIGYDPHFLVGEPGVPTEIFADGVGEAYYEWLRQNFHPQGADAPWRFCADPGRAGLRLRELFWGLVRNHPDFKGISRPAHWNTLVEPVKVR